MSRPPLALAATALLALALAGCAASDPVPAGSSAAAPSAASPSAASSTASATSSDRSGASSSEAVVTATSDDLCDTDPETPADLLEQLRAGGNVVVFRYTGATRPADAQEPPAELAGQGVIDDGQRISAQSVAAMREYGARFDSAEIPVDRVRSSQYFFVWQHAVEAFGEPVGMDRRLTGSLDFSDPAELEASLQGLRDLTVTPPAEGTNEVLFTHQGKFDKAYGYYPDAGTTLVFRPDGSGEPKLVAVLSMEEFLDLTA